MMLKKTIELVLGLIFVAALVPVAITYFLEANTSTWTTPMVALWGIVGIVVVVIVVYMLVDGHIK